MTEVVIKVYANEDAEYHFSNLKKLGYVRTQNAYWVEWWEKNNNRVVIERDF